MVPTSKKTQRTTEEIPKKYSYGSTEKNHLPSPENLKNFLRNKGLCN